MSERLAGILVSSFTRILIPGIKVTIPLTLLSFVFGCIIALFLALVQIANVKGLKQFARFYIWVFREPHLLYSCSSSSLACRLSELSWTLFHPL